MILMDTATGASTAGDASMRDTAARNPVTAEPQPSSIERIIVCVVEGDEAFQARQRAKDAGFVIVDAGREDVEKDGESVGLEDGEESQESGESDVGGVSEDEESWVFVERG